MSNKNQMIINKIQESPEYINTDNEYENCSEFHKARTAKNQKKQDNIKLTDQVDEAEDKL